MIIIRHDYRAIHYPEMSENFIIRPEKVLKIWDIRKHEIGIRFISSYDKNEHRITVGGEDKNLLAKDFLELLLKDDTTIVGTEKIK